MIVNRIIVYKDQLNKEVIVRKDIDPYEIVSFEEFTTAVENRKALYVYAKTHEFVIDSDFDTFSKDLKMAKLVQ